MKSLRALVIALLVIPSIGLAGQAKATYTVSNAKELVQRLGPNRTIVLRKGDYRLSTAYDVKNPAVEWEDGEDGKELGIRDIANLTIRGMDGARIISESTSTYIFGVYGGSAIEIDNVSIVRELEEDIDIGAGSLYIEGVEGLTLKRLSFGGPTGYPIQMWECSSVVLDRVSIQGGTYGGLYAGYTRGIEMRGGEFVENHGYPLIYLEECDGVVFEGTEFNGNSGGNFVEAYAESGYMETFLFSGCAFIGNQFDYFSGRDLVPLTEDCEFIESSFDESWADNSIAPSDESAYYGDYAGPAYYTHYDSGLAFFYPSEWELQEDESGSMIVLFSPYEDSLAFLGKAYDIPSNLNPARQMARILEESLKGFRANIGDPAGIQFKLEPYGEASDELGFPVQDYSGTASKDDGSQAYAYLRFALKDGAVYAFLGLAADEYSLQPGSELGDILFSLELAGR